MIQIIGWTLLHSLWQITLIVTLYWLVTKAGLVRNALPKYYMGLGALVTSFLLPLGTFCYLLSQQFSTISTSTAIPEISESISPTVVLESTQVLPEVTLTWADYLPLIFPYLVAFWAMGILFFSLRFFRNLNQINQLQQSDNELISREWLAKFHALKARLNISKKIAIYLSYQVKEPITFGHFKPVILLPISLMTGFEPAAIETIILHELAHIKRHDYLVNLGQSIIEIILFYHPLVWWLSNDIRAIREHCSDDLVLSLGDNRTTYVETLTALQWRKVGVGVNRLSLSANGKDAGFSARIKRMFGVEEERFSFRGLMGVFLGLLVLSAVGILYENNIFKDSDKPNVIRTEVIHYLDKNTTNKDLQFLIREIKRSGAFVDFVSCENKEGDKWIKSVSGNYFNKDGRVVPFDFNDYGKYPVQFVFENGVLEKAERIQNDVIVLIIDEAFMRRSAKEKNDAIIGLKAFERVMYGAGLNANKIEGRYRSKNDGEISFEVADVGATPIRVVVENGLVISFQKYIEGTYENLSKNEELNVTLIIDSSTTAYTLTSWQEKLLDYGIKLEFGNSTFKNNGFLKDFIGEISQNGENTSVQSSDFPCVAIRFELENNELKGPYFSNPCEDSAENFIVKPSTPLYLNHFKDTTKSYLVISQGISEDDFFKSWSHFQDVTGSDITFDPLTIKEEKIHSVIKGKIRPNKHGFLPSKDIQFDEKDDLISLDGFPPANQNIKYPILKKDAFLPKFQPQDNSIRNIGTSKSVTYVVDGVPYRKNGKSKINPENIESINTISGTKAQLIYGTDKAILIKTKKKTDSKN